MLPPSADPTVVLQQIFPDLCVAGQGLRSPAYGDSAPYHWHQRVAAATTFACSTTMATCWPFRLISPCRCPKLLNPAPWQTLQSDSGTRYRQFTTILHSADAHPTSTDGHNHPSWGYMQIGRTLAPFDAEVRRIRWILTVGLPIALGLVAASSWGLAGLAMQPIYQSYQRQQQFTADAAHELRSPLASLLATVEAILRLPPAQQQDVSPMLQTVRAPGPSPQPLGRRLTVADQPGARHLPPNRLSPAA